MVETSAEKWYVPHTYAGYKDGVKSNLLSCAQLTGMWDFVFRAVTPEETKVETVRGKKQEVEEKVFPGCVLVEMVMTDESQFIVKNALNVTGFVDSHSDGFKPLPLLDDEIARILENQDVETKKPDIDFEIGKTIIVTKGALDGMVGKITSVRENKGKIFISVDMFGRATTIGLDYDQVKKLDGNG